MWKCAHLMQSCTRAITAKKTFLLGIAFNDWYTVHELVSYLLTANLTWHLCLLRYLGYHIILIIIVLLYNVYTMYKDIFSKILVIFHCNIQIILHNLIHASCKFVLWALSVVLSYKNRG